MVNNFINSSYIILLFGKSMCFDHYLKKCFFQVYLLVTHLLQFVKRVRLGSI